MREAAESSSSGTEVSEASSAQEEDREDGVSSTDDSDASEKSAEQTTPAEGKIAEVSSVPGLHPQGRTFWFSNMAKIWPQDEPM